jgi:hypothetical protein
MKINKRINIKILYDYIIINKIIMPRTSTSRPSTSLKSKSINIPKPVNLPPPLKSQPTQNISTIQYNPNGFLENVKQGIAFGTGSALSRVFVDKMFGNVQPKPTNTNMEDIHKKYLECINYASSPEESEKCERYKKQTQS